MTHDDRGLQKETSSVFSLGRFSGGRNIVMIGDYTYFDVTNLIFDLGCPRTGQPQPKGFICLPFDLQW